MCLFFLINIPTIRTVMASAKPIVVVKASLVHILCNPDHLAIYQDRVNTINSLVTAAYLLARYIFVHAYGEEESDRNDDNDSFNADIYMHFSWSCYDLFELELVGLLRTKTHYAIDSSSINT